MSYEELAAVFLTPSTPAPPSPALPTTRARRLRDAIEPIATIGWWSRAATEQFTALGLDFFGGYVWGRAAALGPDVDAGVVVSAFGVFEPTLLTSVLDGARSAASHEAVLAGREAGATDGLRAVVASTTDIDIELVESAGARLRAALDGVDGTARPLFSALRSLPIGADPHAALWRAAEMYREHRGDGNLAASVAAGLDPVEMNVLTELWLGYPIGEYSATRGFGPERIQQAVDAIEASGWVSGGVITESGRAARTAIEAATDLSQHAIIEAIGDGFDDLVGDLETIGAAVVDAQVAPADPRKRAAG
ncbi:SCO6745 family protein [Ilumatobacter coccineus]|uniref:Uncharacterized protein n=1 Tax=Ilumatobacter coccineus (strain NBRC 103263 / KCTC 29153 / YM16-304) TaxID=1313172 RepID=A0A6C7EDB1_ILUCY|nr:hypothetical protein [Ilumatobacter coccineus]BAN01986.1 hypothetical protein YM304_16720 [Ilumatobacter coccineus YM16-304]